VSLVVATLVLASEPLTGRSAASGLLDRWRADLPRQRSMLVRALQIVNRGLRGYRAAALDPYVMEVMELDPRTVRFGYGPAGEIGASRWTDAFAMELRVSAPKARSVEQLRIGETVGGAIAGTAPLFEAEELALRALLDLRHERLRAAAAQARAAAEVLSAELGTPATDPEMAGSGVHSDDPAAIEAIASHVLETAAAFRLQTLQAGHSITAPA
jgi:hypothetical protein